MIQSQTEAYGAFLLRAAMGGLFLYHGLIKLLVFTPAETAGYFGSIGFPGWVAYLIIFAEVAGGAALMLGIFTRLVSLLLVPVMLGTIVFAHGANGFVFSNPGGGWEYPAFWAVTLVVQALLGTGRFALPVPGFVEKTFGSWTR